MIGAVAASRPRPVVYAAPGYAAPPAVYYASPPPTQVIVESAPPSMYPQTYPPPAASYPPPTASYPPPAASYPPPAASYPPPVTYPPAGYPPNPYPPASYPPASYPPTPVSYPEPTYAPAPVSYPPSAPAVAYVSAPAVAPSPVVVEVVRPPVSAPAAVAVGTVAAVTAVEERKHFYLVNEATCTVLGVEKNSLKPGVYLVLEKRRPDKSYAQVWYMDRDGVIRSKLTDFALECKKRDERVHLVPYTGDARQQWTLDGNRILNKIMRNDCLGLRKHLRLKDDADVIALQYEAKPYQHWRMDPVTI